LSSQEISSESEASSAEVSTPAKTMTPKEEYEKYVWETAMVGV
jgi:hypothetical protein